MRGVLFKGNREVELTQFPDPTPGEEEVVIEIKASGMCGSDLNFYRAAPGEGQRISDSAPRRIVALTLKRPAKVCSCCR